MWQGGGVACTLKSVAVGLGKKKGSGYVPRDDGRNQVAARMLDAGTPESPLGRRYDAVAQDIAL